MSYFFKNFIISFPYVVALSPSRAWNIHGFNISQTSLFFDWSNVPVDLQIDFFILSLNQTRPEFSFNDGETGGSFFRIVDSLNTTAHATDLPVFSQYIVTVYLVDINGEVYKSDTIVVQTDEGGKYIISQRFHLSVRIRSSSFLKH